MNRSEYFARDFSKVALPRTKRMMPFQHLTAFNTGDIVPLMSVEIYPGMEWKSKVAGLIYMFTPLKQIFSNIYLDLHAFFVPNRLVWTHWVNFCGQNDTTAWTETGVYTVPTNHFFGPEPTRYDTSGSDNQYPGSLADYFGINPDVPGDADKDAEYSANDLFRRGYIMIYNEWYRDENVIAPVLFSKGDNPEDSQVVSYSDRPLKAAKFHDVFTTLLPEPQKGDKPVVGDGEYPVVPGDDHLSSGDQAALVNFASASSSGVVGSGASNVGIGINGSSKLAYTTAGTFSAAGYVVPTNLWAKVAITIEDIRQAAVATHVLEKLATSGSRYPEFLQGVWSVTAANAELQIPELLGVQRFPISISEVISNADTASESAGEILGATGARSKTGVSGHLFNKAFTEYGILYVMGVIRVEQDYFQGNHPKFKRTGFFSYYNPLLEGIGNQPVPKSWLKADASGVLGYSEPWPELEHLPYQVSSIMRPDVASGLSHWTAAEVYSGTPALNQAFIEQGASGLDRCLAIPSTTRGSFQWFGQFRFMNEVTQIKSPHPVPGVTRI